MGPALFILLSFLARQSAQITLLRVTLAGLPGLPPDLVQTLTPGPSEATNQLMNEATETNLRRFCIAFAQELRQQDPENPEVSALADGMERIANRPEPIYTSTPIQGTSLSDSDWKWLREAFDKPETPPPPS